MTLSLWRPSRPAEALGEISHLRSQGYVIGESFDK